MQDNPASVQKRIVRDLIASLKPVTPLPSVPILAAGFVAGFLALALAGIAMTDTAGLQAMNAPQLIAVTAVLAAGAILGSVFLVWEMIPGSRRLMSALVARRRKSFPSIPSGVHAAKAIFPPGRKTRAISAEDG
jgi:hypothetical protein